MLGLATPCALARPAEPNPAKLEGGLGLELGDFARLRINLTALEDKQIRELRGSGQGSAKLEAEAGVSVLPKPRSPLPKSLAQPRPCSTAAHSYPASPGCLHGVPGVPLFGQASGWIGRALPSCPGLGLMSAASGRCCLPLPFPCPSLSRSPCPLSLPILSPAPCNPTCIPPTSPCTSPRVP